MAFLGRLDLPGSSRGPLGALWGPSFSGVGGTFTVRGQLLHAVDAAPGGAVTPSAAQVIRRITGKQLPQAAGCRNPFTADLTDLHPSRGMPDTDSVRTLFLSRECFPLKFRIESYAPPEKDTVSPACLRGAAPSAAAPSANAVPRAPRAPPRRDPPTAQELGGERSNISNIPTANGAKSPTANDQDRERL